MSLALIDVEVPTDRLPSVSGAEGMVQTRAKLLPAPPPVRPHPGNELDMQISDEMAVELAIGDPRRGAGQCRRVPHLRDRQRAA